jgi:hypothetical protein
MTFLQYLQDIYLHRDRDVTRDGFDDWLGGLDIDDVISHAEKWGSYLIDEDYDETTARELKISQDGYKAGYIEGNMDGHAEAEIARINEPNASNKPRIAKQVKAMKEAGEI